MALEAYLKNYRGFHLHPGNKFCHYVGIPMIVFSSLGLLSQVGLAGDGFFRIDAALVLWALAAMWYVFQEPKLGSAFSVFLLGVDLAARPISPPAHWVIFVLGWVLQGVGHYHYEKKSPAFYQNFEHLLVGPIWIFSRLFE